MTLTNDESVVVRSALFPRFLTESGLFSHELVVAQWGPLPRVEGEGRVWALSIGLGSMLADDSAVHDFGCRTAAAANSFGEAKANEAGTEFERVHYRGSYNLNTESVIAIDPEKFDVVIAHAPEDDRPEHGHIELRPKDAQLSNSKAGLARAEFIADLFLLLRSPREHICQCDEELRPVLEEILLPEVKAA